MDRAQLQELSALAATLIDFALWLGNEGQGDDNMTAKRIAHHLAFLKSTLDSFPPEGSIDKYSPMMPRLENSRHAIIAVKGLFNGIASQSDNLPSHFSLWPLERQNKLGKVYEDLQRSANSLSLALDAGQNLGGSESVIRQAEVKEQAFDLLSKQIMDASSQMFPPDEPGIADFPGFTVSELMMTSSNTLDRNGDFKVVCPRAYFWGEVLDETKENVEFRCCCDEAPHQPLLRYKRWAGKSLLREEICLDGLPRWSLPLLKSDKPVVARLSDVSCLCFFDMQAFATDFHQKFLKDHVKSPNRLFGIRKLAAKLAGECETNHTLLEWIINDSGFPATRIRCVTSDSGEVKRTISDPPIVKLKHYLVFPTHLVTKNMNESIIDIAVPEPFIRLVLEGSVSTNQWKEVLVTKETQISNVDKALGRFVVSLIEAAWLHEGDINEKLEFSNISFSFDLHKDAETFATYVNTAQKRLRAILVSCRMPGERFIHLREFPVTTLAGRKTIGRFVVIAQEFEDGSECKYRAVLSGDGHPRHISFENITQKGLVAAMEGIDIWVSDYDRSGRRLVFQTTWERLTQGQITPSSEAITLVKSGHKRTTNDRLEEIDQEVPTQQQTTPSKEGATFVKNKHKRTADDWLEEIDRLIRAMKRDKNDGYERVKIAVIDSGLNDTVKDRYMTRNRIVYKDFTNETRNDSWHGTCCTKIISDIYEEASLFIARIFEKDHANEKDGPIRMAQAVDWAISPPNCVDIISISAGFRYYSKELDEAVTRAKAAGTLVVAAAANWQNTGTVAFPARHNLTTMCIYSTNVGNQGSSFNPEPRSDTSNFAILGEGFQHPDQRRNKPMNGTSMATAVAVGLAANIIDFSRQQDNKSYISRAQDVGKLPGMLSIFSAISKPAGPLRYVAPLELLPLQHGSNRERDRQRVREILSQAMERAN